MILLAYLIIMQSPVAGDLNVLASQDEKAGGGTIDHDAVSDFVGCMTVAGLYDPAFTGSKYTWCNNQQGTNRIWYRLA